MAGFLKSAGSFLLYKEPKNTELGFELLETAQEKTGQDGDGPPTPQKPLPPQAHTQKKKTSKAPLSVPEWNESRKAESEYCVPSGSDDVSGKLCVSLETIKQKFLIPKNQDIVIREFKIGRKLEAFIAYVDGMVDKQILNLSLFPSVMDKAALDGFEGGSAADYLTDNVLPVHSVSKSGKYSDIVMQILNGSCALFIENCNECVIIEIKGFEKRNVQQTLTENVVKGSQEGFTEDLRTNITLVRRIIRNENLVTEIMPVGNTNHSSCAVIYLDGVANPAVVGEVKKRIQSIDTDFIMGDCMIEQFIEDNPFMLFPQILSTERPDRTASFLMEGQVVIIANGTPFAMAVPVTFFGLFHTSEDIAVRWPLGSFLRLIRLVGLFCATWLPGLYIAITLFHNEMLPTELLHSIAVSKESVPFPTVVEVLIMEISFELIREGGIRVPTAIGQTLGIVGALILGQAAVSAGLVSPLLVIVVAMTGLGSFAIPNYTLGLAVRLERFLFIFAGAFLGFYGISLMIALLSYVACSMKSFGVPFFSPIAPKTKMNRDVILRLPIWTQKNRPDEFNTLNRKRQGNNQKLWIDQPKKGNQGEGGGQ